MKRVVVTGIGVIAPNASNKEEFWRTTAEGKSYIVRDQEMVDLGMKSTVLSRINNFNIGESVNLSDYPDELISLDKFVQYGVFAGEQAVFDANLFETDFYSREEIGVVFSSAIGGTPTIADIFADITNRGTVPINYHSVGSRFYNSGMFNYPATLLAKRYQLEGPCTSVTTGCTAGIDAVGMGYELIKMGDCKAVIVGASEAPLTGLTYATLDVINALSTTDCEPEKASRPFDAKRSGFVISEGSVVFILEELESALKRNANIYAEVKSYATVSNAIHMTDLPKDGASMAKVITNALKFAGFKATDLHYINSHGSSTPQNDVFETAAYHHALGEHAPNVPISSVKSMVGHALASASLMGALCVIGAIKNSVISPTINYEFPDPECDLDYVPNIARHQKVVNGLVNASGFGGIHSAAIFSNYERL